MTPDDNAILTGTGPDSPLGKVMRRYWLPALLSSELEKDGAPQRVRLLGENLVAFRDSSGRVGLFDEHCRHRGASLYWGNNADNGIRCWYHGWKFDVDGHCLELPNDANGERLKERVHQKCYPTVERGGVVFTYMGPPELRPGFPELEWANLPEGHVYVSKRLQDCHWLQGLEGDIDSSHIGFLHGMHTMNRATEYDMSAQAKFVGGDVHPKFEIVEKPNGILQGARRDAGNESYWRIGGWLMPCFTLLPGFPGDSPLGGHAWVPVDDTKVWVFGVNWHPKRKLSAEELRQYHDGSPTGLHSTMIPGTPIALRNKSNDYAHADAPADAKRWEKVLIFQDQDTAVTESMGWDFDRTNEFLCGSDIVIVSVRRRLLAAARDLMLGKSPPTDPREFRYRGISCVLPSNVPSWAQAVSDAMDARPETFIESV